ncbi:MAG TPA: hypothetical protein VHK02_05080 [Actinomycetota bacterium]|jgi:hypothetical protein|nr:hypothetical protein [Actinomycetota bacterium]
MSVHVGELRSEVVPVVPAAAPAASSEQEQAERVAAATRRACWLAERVAAEGFDD